MSKSNFYVDPEFPVIDGVGHSDRIDFLNVRGGGSTNTTMFDAAEDGVHNFFCIRSLVPVLSGSVAGSYTTCAVDPSRNSHNVANPGCLNSPMEGDNEFRRCSDAILLKRIIVNGVCLRPACVVDNSPQDPAPKVFVLLYADKRADGSVADLNDVLIPPYASFGGLPQERSGLPLLNHEWMTRYSVLAYDVIDFDASSNLMSTYSSLEGGVTTGGPLPVPEEVIYESQVYTNCHPIARGFRFDVDLNDALCKFLSDSGDYTSLANLGLHMGAVLFDGSSSMGFAPAVGQPNYVTIEYKSWLLFEDFMSAKVFAPAGVDGPVVPDEAPELDILADQSAALAGDAPEPRWKKTKASEGFFNFRPRNDPALDAFPDDFEFARLKSAKRSKSRGSRGQKFRRTDDPGEFFDDEAEPPYRRGKY